MPPKKNHKTVGPKIVETPAPNALTDKDPNANTAPKAAASPKDKKSPKQSKSSKKDESTPTTAASLSSIHLDGEENEEVPIFATADDVRKQVNAHIPSTTKAAFARELTELLPTSKVTTLDDDDDNDANQDFSMQDDEPYDPLSPAPMSKGSPPPASTPAPEESAVSKVHPPKDETESTKIYATCDDIRIAINSHLKTTGTSKVAFASHLEKMLPKSKVPTHALYPLHGC
ncbi:uncharacterized protein RCC_12299 [Ramularia collo-cygni]|uniref:Uncharacterized protein n=1 Tax=Ramularia collo-cygni TaxID=112498 RepID=A0A2D3V4F4_9PEZI|nr:uncharacterized protein RCC_12299 [Ramularia collo-cygni]CZT15173.1 uncharacterized protein RCC_12299 [Ramularia collo-cygni]